MRYFKKILPERPVLLSSGRGLKFPTYPSGVGLLAVEESKRPDLIREFEKLIGKQVGGVIEITLDEFEAEKKSPPKKQVNEGFSPTQIAQISRAAQRAAAAVADREREEGKRQLTPTISRAFKRPGVRFAGATANPGPNQTQPGQWRPGLAER